MTTSHIPHGTFWNILTQGCRHDFGEQLYTLILTQNEIAKGVSNMKAYTLVLTQHEIVKVYLILKHVQVVWNMQESWTTLLGQA